MRSRIPCLSSLVSFSAAALSAALASTASSLAVAGPPAECGLQAVQPELISNFPAEPSYFARVTADGRYMGYITESGNFILDLQNPETQVQIPGPYDPVPAPPSGAEMQVRHFSAPTYGGMGFFDIKQIVQSMQPGVTTVRTDLQPVMLDENNQDNYQSMGVLPGPKGLPVYRMISGSLTVRDYATYRQPWDADR